MKVIATFHPEIFWKNYKYLFYNESKLSNRKNQNMTYTVKNDITSHKVLCRRSMTPQKKGK